MTVAAHAQCCQPLTNLRDRSVIPQEMAQRVLVMSRTHADVGATPNFNVSMHRLQLDLLDFLALNTELNEIEAPSQDQPQVSCCTPGRCHPCRSLTLPCD
jgi:hypothetical protein